MIAKQEIKCFLETSAKDIGLTPEYVENGLNDINLYIEGIKHNYKTLKNFITTEWQKIQKGD